MVASAAPWAFVDMLAIPATRACASDVKVAAVLFAVRQRRSVSHRNAASSGGLALALSVVLSVLAARAVCG